MIEGAPTFVGAGEGSTSYPKPTPKPATPGGNLLERRAFPFSSPSSTPLQTHVDQAVGSFVHHATQWKSICAMTAGSLAFRWGRLGLSPFGLGAECGLPFKMLSVGAGLVSEVSAFEVTHRALQKNPLGNPGKAGEENLWRFNGALGLKNGFITSLVTFGALKAGGALAQGQNLVLQHLVQDSAMVLGHQIAGRLGLAPLPAESLAEQFLNAEATNLQLGAGAALGHAATGGRVQALERGMDITLRPFRPGAEGAPLFTKTSPELAFAVNGFRGSENELAPEKDLSASISAMSNLRDPAERSLALPVSPRALTSSGAAAPTLRLSEAKTAVLRENYLSRFPDAARSHSDEIIDAVLTFPEYSTEFHNRLLEALSLSSYPTPGSAEQLYVVKAMEHVMKCDSLNTNTGSFENARLQYLIQHAAAEDSQSLRMSFLFSIMEAMERGLNPIAVDSLFERFEIRDLGVESELREIPLAFRKRENFYVHDMEGEEARIFVDDEGRASLQNLNPREKLWLVNEAGQPKEVPFRENRPLSVDSEFIIGSRLDSGRGYVLKKKEGRAYLLAGATNLQLLLRAAGKAVPKQAQAILAYQEAKRPDLYDREEVESAFEFARAHSQGKIALTHLLHVLYARDIPSKIRELRFETRKDTLQKILSLHRQGMDAQKIAEEINGTYHTAYIDDMRLARKVVSVFLDVAPYILKPGKIEERARKLEKAMMALLTAQEVEEGAAIKEETLADRIGVDELKELLQEIQDPMIEAFLNDWSANRFRLRLTPGETILRLIGKMPEKESIPGSALFVPAGKKDGPDMLLIRELPPTPLKTETDLQNALREVREQFIRWLHEQDHWRSSVGAYIGVEAGGEPIDFSRLSKIDRPTRLVSEIMGHLEDNRLIFKNVGLDYLEIVQRLGTNLVFYWRDENDYGYFDPLNRRLSRGESRP